MQVQSGSFIGVMENNLNDLVHNVDVGKLSAPDYIEALMNWIRMQIEDEKVMPTKPGVGFNKKFEALAQVIFKRMSRVYAHLYKVHFDIFQNYRIDAILNTSFKHFVFFIQEFDLVSSKDLMPLQDLISAIDNE